jgi:hypothetical protein
LPDGAPSGQHLIRDRTLTSVRFSPSETTGVPSYLLVTGPEEEKGSYIAALYLAPQPQTPGEVGDLTSALLLADGFYYNSTKALLHDSLGRILGWSTTQDANRNVFWRIDLSTGAREILGPPGWSSLTLSPDRTRVLVSYSGGFAVCELDGASVAFSGAWSSGVFAGENLFVSIQSDLWRVRPHGQPEMVVASAQPVYAISTWSGPELIIRHTDASGKATGHARVDPETLQETPFPSGGAPLGLINVTDPMSPGVPEKFGWAPPSRDEQWLPILMPSAGATTPLQPTDGGQMVFLNLTTSEMQYPNTWVSVGEYGLMRAEWRPGSDELWFTTRDEFPTLQIWKPDTQVTRLYDMAILDPTSAFFTSDGDYFFSSRNSDRNGVYVGSAQDPKGPVHHITPSGIDPGEMSRRPLAGNRVLIAGYLTAEQSRREYFLAEPDAFAPKPFIFADYFVASGSSRALFLANQDPTFPVADLILIDFETRAQTLLAQSVYAATVDPGPFADAPPADALAPGTRVAFLLRNRIASPYDGLWVAELP